MYVTGLTPGAAYAVSVASGVVTIATGSGSAADGAGVLTVSFSAIDPNAELISSVSSAFDSYHCDTSERILVPEWKSSSRL